jgi:hypothetical protein
MDDSWKTLAKSKGTEPGQRRRMSGPALTVLRRKADDGGVTTGAAATPRKARLKLAAKACGLFLGLALLNLWIVSELLQNMNHPGVPRSHLGQQVSDVADVALMACIAALDVVLPVWFLIPSQKEARWLNLLEGVAMAGFLLWLVGALASSYI